MKQSMIKSCTMYLMTLCLVLGTFTPGISGRVNVYAAERTELIFSKNLSIPWDWNLFFQDATTAEEDLNLAVAGLVMSRNAEISKTYMEDTLRKLGFDTIESSYYRLSTVQKNDIGNPARTFGHKTLEKDGKKYHLICAVFKGTTTIPDAITDINSIVDGFYTGGYNCTNSLTDYINGISGASKDNTILFITGHSLGASTANMVGRLCLQNDLVNENAEFVYAYASPNYRTDNEENDGKSHLNFRTFTNTADVVPTVPPNYTRINKQQEHVFDYNKLTGDDLTRFNRVYEYFRGKTFENDKSLTDLIALLKLLTGENQTNSFSTYEDLKNHLAHTYMSFILSEQLTDQQLDDYLARLKASDLTVNVGSTLNITLGKTKDIVTTASNPVTITSANPAVASVSNTTVKANKVGTTMVKVYADGSSKMKTGTKEIKVVVKKANPFAAKAKTTSVRKGKTVILKRSKVLTLKNAKGTVTYTKKAGNKKIIIGKKTGKVKVKKGLKKGTYKVKVLLKAAGNNSYWSKKLTKTFKIKVK